MGRKALNAKQKLTTPEKPACVRNADQISKKRTTENGRILRPKDATSGPPRFAEDLSGKLEPDMDDSSFASAFMESFGGGDPQFGLTLMGQAAKSIFKYERAPVHHINYALAALHGIRPRDPLEALLVVQMLGVHNLSTEFMRRAALSNQSQEGADLAVNWCTKLNRTFVAQMEVLMRYRSQGQQKVIVEHVHVNQGGQAVVGVVNRTNNQDADKSGG